MSVCQCVKPEHARAPVHASSHCKGVQKQHPLRIAGGMQEVRILSEPDVLRLIVSSHLPEDDDHRNSMRGNYGGTLKHVTIKMAV